jgi:prepilin-type N-terminal cleavage/methylation domain-containing protein
MQRVRARTRGEVDKGFTLVEVLVTIVILGTGVIAILAALGTLQASADVHRSKSQAQSLVLSAAEWVVDEGRNPYRYSACATDYFPAATGNRYAPLAAGDPAPVNATPLPMPVLSDGTTHWNPVTTLQVQVTGYWNGTVWYENAGTRVAQCQALENDPAGTFIHMQKVTIIVTSPDGRGRESLVVVKRGS